MDVTIAAAAATASAEATAPFYAGTPTLRMTLLGFIASLGYNPADVEQVVATPTTFTVWYRVASQSNPNRYSLQSDGFYLA